MSEEILNLENEFQKESRQYLRSDTALIAKYSQISHEEYKRKKKHYSSARASFFATASFPDGSIEQDTRIILEYIERLEEKIDRLSSLLLSDKFHEYEHTGEVINISGGGLKLVSTLNLSKGNYLDMCIFFPPAFNNPFFVIGQVRKRKVVMEKDPGEEVSYHLGIKFAAIDERDREAIIKYIFQTERQKLRDAKSTEEDF